MLTPEQLKRKQEAISKATEQNKTAGSVFLDLYNLSRMPPNPMPVQGAVMRKAYCMRLAGRTVVVGNNAFAFDGAGICELRLNGRATVVADFEQLLNKQGVVEIEDTPINVIPVIETRVVELVVLPEPTVIPEPCVVDKTLVISEPVVAVQEPPVAVEQPVVNSDPVVDLKTVETGVASTPLVMEKKKRGRKPNPINVEPKGE